MKKFIASCCSIFLLIPAFSFADEPPDWQPFWVHSTDGNWTAHIYPETTSEDASQDKWRLQVFNKNLEKFPGREDQAAWSSAFKPTGYREGLLSDDGQVFVQISFWYQHKYPLITVYRRDCQREYLANSLTLPKNMPATASHQIWLDQKKNSYFVIKEGQLYLEVFTLVGSRLLDTSCKGK